MNRCWQSFLVAASVALSGCQLSQPLDTEAPVVTLGGPYEFRLSLDRKTASPGELVFAELEFENTGSGVLWIPSNSGLFFGFEQKSQFGTSTAGSWTSSCSGLRPVRVKPHQKVRYQKGFSAPDLTGEVNVYITASRKVTAPLVIQKEASAKSPQLLPPGSRG